MTYSRFGFCLFLLPAKPKPFWRRRMKTVIFALTPPSAAKVASCGIFWTLLETILIINSRAARVVSLISLLRPESAVTLITPTTPPRSAVTKTKNFFTCFVVFCPRFLFFKKEKIFLFCNFKQT